MSEGVGIFSPMSSTVNTEWYCSIRISAFFFCVVNQNTIFSSEGRNSSVVFSCVFNVISKFVLFLCCVHIFIVANNVLHVCPVSFSRFFLDCLFNVQYMYTRDQYKGCQSDLSLVLHVYVRVKSMHSFLFSIFLNDLA